MVVIHRPYRGGHESPSSGPIPTKGGRKASVSGCKPYRGGQPIMNLA